MHIKRPRPRQKVIALISWFEIHIIDYKLTIYISFLNRFFFFFQNTAFKNTYSYIKPGLLSQKKWFFSNRGSIPILNCAHTLCKSLHWEHDEAPQQFLMPSIAVSEEWLASNGTLLNVHPRLNANLIAPTRDINSILLNAEDLFAARQGHERTRFTSKYKRYHNNAI